MIYQTAMPDPNFEHVGCAFDSTAYGREKLLRKPWSVDELEAAWKGALSGSILDANFVIQDWQELANFFQLPLKFLGRFDPDDGFDRSGKFIVAEWHNDRTNFDHFVVGESRPVEWDPIEGGSVTVREGYVKSLRVFEVLG